MAQNDTKMVAEHARQSNLDRLDIRHAFWPGDLCLLRAPAAGKLKRNALGPYTFDRYVGWRSVNTEIVGANGISRTVSMVNLRTLNGRTHMDVYRNLVEEGQDLH